MTAEPSFACGTSEQPLLFRTVGDMLELAAERWPNHEALILDVAVVGVADSKHGEEVCAVVRLREGERANHDEIIAFCRGQIAHYKIPRYVRFVDNFPMTVTGKVQKFILREQIERAMGLRTEDSA
jgi:acyl-CoA synthetase (AMP-forming)/AMP-acid ligase II